MPVDPNDVEIKFDPAGSGYLRIGGLAIDEPLAVGANGLTQAQRMARALDIVGNRQFLDRGFNSGTKGAGDQVNRPAGSVVSVVDDPGAIWRPSLENVLEWRDLANFVKAKVQPRIQNQTSPAKVKKIINDAIRNELKKPTTDAGRKLNAAMKKTTGVDPEDIFRPRTAFKQLWSTTAGRQALFNVGVILAGAIVSYAASASASEAEAKAKEDLIKISDDIGRYATDHPDEGILIVQVFEVRQMSSESAAITTYRYTATEYGKKEHLALWRFQDRASISQATDAFSEEYQEYIWVPPLNERGSDVIPGPPNL